MALTERSKAMYQPWNQEGFNADLRVRRMTNVQRWIYKSLLQEAFVCSTRPRLPDDDEELWIMADCDNLQQWLENKSAIISMFERIQEDGTPLLLHKKLEEDWDRLQEKRNVRSIAGRKGGLAKSSNAKQNIANSTKGSEGKGSEVSEVKGSEANPTPEEEIFIDGQGEEVNLRKLKEELSIAAAGAGVVLGGYDTSWEQVVILSKAHGSGALITDFTEWLQESRGDDFPKGALVSYLRVAPARLVGDSAPATRAAKDDRVVGLTREITFLSKGAVTFQGRHKVLLLDLLKEYEPEEILSAFRTFVETKDLDDPYVLKFVSQNFLDAADGLAYAARKQKQEAAKEKAAREETDRIIRERKEEENRQRLEKEAAEAALFDPFA